MMVEGGRVYCHRVRKIPFAVTYSSDSELSELDDMMIGEHAFSLNALSLSNLPQHLFIRTAPI